MLKRFLAVSAMSLLLSAYVSAQVKWDGGGDNISWNDPLNWDSDLVPLATDDVILDNTTVPGSYDVTLPAGTSSVTINSLTITPAAANNIRLLLPVTNTAVTALHITGTGNSLNLNDRASLINSSSANISLDGNVMLAIGSLLDISSGTSDNILSIKGNLVISGTITESGTSAFSGMILNGSANQDINVSATGAITGNQLDFSLSNAAGATLLADLTLPYRYTIVGGNLTLGNFSLTTPFVNQLAPVTTNHIITNGSGFLIIPNIGMAIVIFPIGIDATSANQVEISNGSGLTYSIRVEPGVNPDIALPLYAIDRTWIINTNSIAANPTPATVTFYYYTGQGRANFNYASSVDIGKYLSPAWNIVQNDLLPASFPPEYRAFTSINSFNTSFIVGNHGAILPLDFAIVCKAQKNNGAALISWNVGSDENVTHFEIEKSVNGSGFSSISSITPDTRKLSYGFNDNDIQDGNVLYRVKVFLNNGAVRYSNTVALVYNIKSMLITSIAPNPVHNSARITISCPGNASVKLLLFDAQGKMLRQWQYKISDGTNIVTLSLDDLTAGVYFLSGTDGNIKMNVMRLVKQ